MENYTLNKIDYHTPVPGKTATNFTISKNDHTPFTEQDIKSFKQKLESIKAVAGEAYPNILACYASRTENKNDELTVVIQQDIRNFHNEEEINDFVKKQIFPGLNKLKF